MYWGAFMGRQDMTEAFIRAGYSPIVMTYKNIKSAIFACVSGNRYELLDFILKTFNYVPKDKELFMNSKSARDAKGNTVMHLAYQL